MVGRGVLLECLDHPDVETVLVLNRHSINIQHPKLREILVKDFFDLSAMEEELSGYNSCFFCLGISAGGMKENDYHRITVDLTLNFAEAVLKQSPGLVFCYVSGAGTNENSRMMWARVKGKVEAELMQLPFEAAYLFRPGFIQPLRNIKSRTQAYNILYTLFTPLAVLLKYLPKAMTSTTNVGKAMIKATRDGYVNSVLTNEDINGLAKE